MSYLASSFIQIFIKVIIIVLLSFYMNKKAKANGIQLDFKDVKLAITITVATISAFTLAETANFISDIFR